MFISYAQNFEDVILWRALKDIPNGLYIDVGAWSPDIDSVTRAFYEHGWRGINIEPNPEFISLYKERRPEDINLSLAVSTKTGVESILFFENPGLSSMSKAVYDEHLNKGLNGKKAEVKTMPLKDICGQYASGKEIHFLKVDVEGYEKNVLESADFDRFRPWIIVVEATKPMGQEENFSEWEHILTQAKYNCVYEDGLNRYYLADERSGLKESFRFPPNFFDFFVTAENVRLNDLNNKLNEDIINYKNSLEEANAQLNRIRSSIFWKLSKPLRLLLRAVRKINGK
jgi:FkbM family methyltransferase